MAEIERVKDLKGTTLKAVSLTVEDLGFISIRPV
jgi:hypothetical protein